MSTLESQNPRDELLSAAYVYINNYVAPEEAEIDGFDVLAWCQQVEALGLAPDSPDFPPPPESYGQSQSRSPQ